MIYRVFTRKWWKENPSYENGLGPDSRARKHTIGHACTVEEARAMCKEWNDEHDPGRYSRKAEFMED